MITAAMILGVISITAIVFLFVSKRVELNSGRALMPGVVRIADTAAQDFKTRAAQARHELSRLPPTLARATSLLIHEAALGFAALARYSEAKAHQVADFVSSKHRFERRESRSEYLKEVSNHKNGFSS